MRNRIWMKAAAALMVTMSLTAPVFAGTWQQDAATGKYWYDNGGGSYFANGPHTIDGTVYDFDSSGFMLTGWQQVGSGWHYFDPGTGAEQRGWVQVGDKWYYLDPTDGAMRTGFVEIGRELYYFHPDGAMQGPGLFHNEDGTKTYRAGADGALYRNKSDIDLENNYVVRYDNDGVMTTVNDHSRLVAEAGGEKYREVMDEANAAERKNEDSSILRSHGYELMGELEENYIKRVVGRKGNTKTSRRTEWEAKVRKQLNGFVDSSEIEAFIRDVEGRSYYKTSDGEYNTYYSDGWFDLDELEDYDEDDD